MHLSTYSRHEHFLDTLLGKDSRSWFDIVIFKDDRSLLPKTDAKGSPLAWQSHVHPIGMDAPKYLNGAYFGPEHEMWKSVEPGNVLGVVLCTEGGWCRAGRGRLCFWKRFEPSIPL